MQGDKKNFQVFTFNEAQEVIRPKYRFNNFSGTIGLVFSPSPKLRVSSILGTAWQGVDLVEPPAAHNLFGVQTAHSSQLFGNDFEINLEVINLLNTAYREYLNRFRYFADEPGRGRSFERWRCETDIETTPAFHVTIQ